MSANDLQQSLLNSMQLLSQNTVNHNNAVKSIKATIVKINDEGLNTYTVCYGGNQFEAIAANINVKYQTGDIVYILIPDGDFSQKKLIIGAVAARATMYSSTSMNPYIKISGDLFHKDDITLKTWIPGISLIELDDFERPFIEYLQKYRTVLFTAKIRTNIDKNHQVKGNYGLRLILPFKRIGAEGESEEADKIFIMDIESMQGNPYAYTKEQLINLYFDIESGLTYDTTRQPILEAFVEGFDYLDNEVDPEADPDIFINNIALQIVDTIPESAKEGYSLSLVASGGIFFLTGEINTTKILTPRLTLDGNETSLDTWNCYWFAEDPSIKVNNKGYHKLGGQGWRCINDKSSVSYDSTGQEIFNYVSNKYSYIIQNKENNSEVVGSLKYKCVLAQDDEILSSTIEIKNLNNNIELSLFSPSGSTIFPKDTGNVDLVARIYYPNVTDLDRSSTTITTEWQRFDKNNNLLDTDFYTNVRVNDQVTIEDKKVLETEIQYPCTSVDELNIITCTFYANYVEGGDAIKRILGTAQISITTSENLGYRILTINTDVIYKYDADGDAPNIANYDGPISSKVDIIKPISFRLFKEDGTELTEDDYKYCKYQFKIPVNSMISLNSPLEEIDGYYIKEGYGQEELKYNINPTYNKTKNNNTIILTLEYAGNVIQEAINIKFIKDGESGTNGSKYAVLIQYKDANDNNAEYAYGARDKNGKVRKLQFVYVNGTGWKLYDIAHEQLVDMGSPQMTVEVYKDGQLLEQTDNYSVSWNMFDSIGSGSYTNQTCFNINQTTGIINGGTAWSDFNTVYTNIIQAKVTILNNNNTVYAEEIYAYYPIEITRVVNSSYTDKIIPTLEGGYSEVLYSSGSVNPTYDNSNPFVFRNNVLNSAYNYYTYLWEVNSDNENLEIESDNGKQAIIKPATKYDSNKSKNYVKATLQMTADQQAQLEQAVSEAEIKISNLELETEYYNNVKSLVGNIFNNFSYDNYISHLDDAQLLLLYIKQATDIFKELNSLGEDIKNYYIRNEVQPYILMDLNSIINEKLIIISQEKTNIHNLIKGGNLDLITDLQSCVITLVESSVTDVNIYYQIKAMIDRWNQLINMKYNSIYQALIRQNSSGYIFAPSITNLYNNIYLSLKNYVTNTLNSLAQNYQSRQADQEFINLKDSVEKVINRLDNVDTINSYSDIVDKILLPISNLIFIYSDTNYQTKHYTELIDDLNKQQEEKEKEKIGYEKADFSSLDDVIIHIKPIVMIINNYEFSDLNGWDGNKLYIDGGEQYLYAPKVGAGIKNNNNKFTGITMGLAKLSDNYSNIDVGLFGFHEGTRTIFLDANTGNAIFGIEGSNAIKITPNSATISFEDDSTGKIYSGSHDHLDETTDGFYLSSDGLSIKDSFIVNANTGVIELGSTDKITISSNSSEIHFGSNTGKIYSGNHEQLSDTISGFYLASDGLSIGDCLTVDDNGVAIKKGTIKLQWGSGSNNNYFEVDGIGAIKARFITLGDGGYVELGDASHITLGIGGHIEFDYASYITLGNYSHISLGTYSYIEMEEWSNVRLKENSSIDFPQRTGVSQRMGLVDEPTSNGVAGYFAKIQCTGNIVTNGSLSGSTISQNGFLVLDASTGVSKNLPTLGTLANATASTNVPNLRVPNGTSGGTIQYVSTSSKRIKHDIKDIENNDLNPYNLLKLPVRQFKYNLDYLNKKDFRYNKDIIGFIAEEVDQIYPVACDYYAEDGLPYNWNERYMIPAMLKLIQDQYKDIEILKQQIKEIKGGN